MASCGTCGCKLAVAAAEVANERVGREAIDELDDPRPRLVSRSVPLLGDSIINTLHVISVDS